VRSTGQSPPITSACCGRCLGYNGCFAGYRFFGYYFHPALSNFLRGRQMTIEAQIKDYIAKNLLFSSDGFKYSDDASFLEEGIVDSQGVMELVLFVEENFNIQVKDTEIIPDNFDSVSRLSAYIQRKQG
jgi:acyl carrier protein